VYFKDLINYIYDKTLRPRFNRREKAGIIANLIPLGLMMRIFLLFMLLAPLALHAQSNGYYDTLNLARQRMNENRISEAILILEACERSHPNDVDVIRLRGQALYWSKDFDKTLAYFRKAIRENSEAMVLKMDYGRILFDMNLLDEAKNLIITYHKAEPADVEAQLILGTIAYWQGKPPKEAFLYLNPVLAQYPTNPRALALAKEIHQATSPWIKISSGYYSDSQPLNAPLFSFETGLYQSSWLQPTFQAQRRNMDDESVNHHTESFQLANKSAFLKTKTEVLVKTGIFNRSWTTNVLWTGGVEIKQKLSKTYTLSGSIERSPYFHTVRSLSSNVSQINYSGSLGREMANSWSGEVIYNVHQFNDNNQVKTFGVWFVLPIIESPAFKFDFGYAYHNADSKFNTFVNDKTLGEIVANYYPGYTITGVYDPYFTPQNQYINSLLGNITLNLANSFKLSVKTNAGLYAVVNNPYFYLNFDKRHQLVLEKGYSQLHYFPIEMKVEINWMLSDKIMLEAEYLYRKTFFFTSNLARAGLKINFWNEKRR
jgi:tetratricopeptide (TPR) repeat protein